MNCPLSGVSCCLLRDVQEFEGARDQCFRAKGQCWLDDRGKVGRVVRRNVLREAARGRPVLEVRGLDPAQEPKDERRAGRRREFPYVFTARDGAGVYDPRGAKPIAKR